MRSQFWTFLLLGSLATIATIALRQARTTTQLNEEAAALRTAIRSVDTHPIEPKTQAKSVTIAENAETRESELLRENQAEAQRLSGEIERLRAEIAAAPKPSKPKDASPQSRSTFTLNEILEAARLGNTHRVAELISFEPGDEEEAQALFAQLPPEIQAQHGSAQHLMASIAALTLSPANSKGVKILNNPQLSDDKSSITWQLELHGPDSTVSPTRIECTFQRSAQEDWSLVVSPEMLTSYRNAVAAAVGKK